MKRRANTSIKDFKTAEQDLPGSLTQWGNSVKDKVISMIDLALSAPDQFKQTYGDDWKKQLANAFPFQESSNFFNVASIEKGNSR